MICEPSSSCVQGSILKYNGVGIPHQDHRTRFIRLNRLLFPLINLKDLAQLQLLGKSCKR